MFGEDREKYDKLQKLHEDMLIGAWTCIIMGLIFMIFFKVAGIIIIAIGIVFMVIGHKTKIKAADLKYYAEMEYNKSKKKNEEIRVKIKPVEVSFPVDAKGKRLYKVYDSIDICIISGKEPDFDSLDEGDKLYFRQEPNNKYDSRAIAVYQAGSNMKIGYFYRGKSQDMTNDFLDRGDIVKARLECANYGNCQMSVAYYK